MEAVAKLLKFKFFCKKTLFKPKQPEWFDFELILQSHPVQPDTNRSQPVSPDKNRSYPIAIWAGQCVNKNQLPQKWQKKKKRIKLNISRVEDEKSKLLKKKRGKVL